MIRFGASGYSYEDWIGPFSPDSLEKRDFLSYYAGRFDAVEVDSTYYRIPPPSMFEAIAGKVPDHFKFCVKTPSTFTHARGKLQDTVEAFRKSVAPLIGRGLLGCFLAQFPYSFTLRFTLTIRTQHLAFLFARNSWLHNCSN